MLWLHEDLGGRCDRTTLRYLGLRVRRATYAMDSCRQEEKTRFLITSPALQVEKVEQA